MSELKEELVAFRKLVNRIPSTTYGVFGLYRYPAKFIPQVVAYVLEKYVDSEKTEVFDPFAGYGTVGYVSRIYGYNYELWDLNPMLGVFHKVATQKPRKIDVEGIVNQMMASNEEFIPKWSNLTYWFPKEFLPMLYNVWGFYHALKDEYIKAILTIPLLEATRFYSYDDIQRQKLSKSPRSIARVQSILNSEWRDRFYRMLREGVFKVINKLEEYSLLSPKEVSCRVLAGIDTLSKTLEHSVDLLITSPPYLQSHEYMRQSKMDLIWLGYSEDEIRELSRLELPYRNVEFNEIHSKTYREIRFQIKEKHLRKVFDNYFHGVLGALTNIQEKVGSYMCIFVGRPSLRGSQVPIDRIFAEHFTEIGWVHETTLVDKIVARRLFRYNSNPATKISDQRTETENLLVLRRKI